jgi:hypothetical protein
MKKPVIIKLWKKKYPVMYMLLICVLLHCQLTLMFAVYLQDIAFVDYNNNKLIWEQISSTWWLKHESCKNLLAILVHKDNKDISSNPTKLPPGDTQKEVRKKKADALADKHATARAARPINIYDNIDHKLKKAKVDGMRSQVEKNLVESIVSQIKIVRQNEEIYKSMLGMTKYQEKIVQLMNELPGLATTDNVGMDTIDMTKDGADNNVEDGNDID